MLDTRFNDSINGLAAAKRISRVTDARMRNMLWFVQHQSLHPNGLQIIDDLTREFPERMGTPASRRIIKSPEQLLTASEVADLCKEIISLGLESNEEDLKGVAVEVIGAEITLMKRS